MTEIKKMANLSDSQFKILFKNIPIPTYTWQKEQNDFILVDNNIAALEITEGHVRDFIGVKASEMYKDNKEILEDLHRCLNEEVNISKDIKYIMRVTGKEKYLSVKYAFVPPNLVIVHTENITERKRMEEALKQKEEMLKNEKRKLEEIMNNTVDGICTLDINGNIIQSNKTFANLIGYESEKQILGTSMKEFTIKDDVPKVISAMKNGSKEGIIRNFEVVGITKQGKNYYASINAKLLKDENGIFQWLGVVRDNTERKKVLERLKKEEQEKSIILESIMEHIVFQSLDHTVIYLNKAACDSVNQPPEQLIGRKCYEIWQKRDDACENCPVELAIKTKKVETNEVETTDGRSWFIKGYPIQDENGNLIGGVEVTTEITEQRRMEQKIKDSKENLKKLNKELEQRVNERTKELKESEEKYRLITENANDLITLLNPKFEHVFINEQTYINVLGYSNDDMIGKTRLDLVHPDDFEKGVKAFKEGFKSGEGKIELRLRHKNGHYLWFEFQGKIYVDDEKKIMRLILGREITERKKTEQKLKESEEKYKNISNELEILLDIIPGMVFCKDKNDIFTRVNNTLADFLKLSKEDILGKTNFDLFPLEQAKRFRNDDLEIINSGKPSLNIEEAVDSPEGTVYVITNKVPQYNEKGEVIGIIGLAVDITERKIIEQKLKESEVKYRYMINNLDMGFFKTDVNGVILVHNPALNKILGFTPTDSLVGLLASDFWENPDETKEYFKELNKKGILRNYIHKARKRNGEPIVLQVESHLMRDKDNKIVEIEGIVLDITKKFDLEQKLKESERKFKNLSYELELIIDNIPGLIFYKDTENSFIRVNKTVADAHNLTKEEMECKSLFDFYPKEQAQAYWHDDLEVIQSGNSKLNIEEPWDIVEGRRWLNTSKIPIVEENGEISGIIGFSIDITEKKLAEQKQKESEEKYRIERDKLINILNIMEEGVIIINKEYDIEYVNPKLIDEFGTFKGKKCYNYFYDKNEVCQNCKSKDFLAGKTIRRDWYLSIKDKTYDIISTPLKNSNRSISILSIFHDITKRKKYELKLKEINRLKSELLTRASHELKTPLISIKGYSDLLLKLHKEKFDDAVISSLTQIKKGCVMLEKIINDMLNTIILDSDKTQTNFERDDLSFLIKYCVKGLEGLALTRDHDIIVNIHDNMITKLEKERIYEVLSNLILNAIKFTPPNGLIKVKSEIKESTYIISVKDNGIGFTEEEKDKIFEKFGKVERYGQGWNLDIEGTGLGLYISRRIIELHGGKIWMKSEGRNKGSKFYFSLPII